MTRIRQIVIGMICAALVDGTSASALLAGELTEAKDVLEELDKQSPGRIDVLTHLVRVHYELGDWASCQTVCRRLLEVDPHDREAQLILGQTCLNMQHPAHALSAFPRMAWDMTAQPWVWLNMAQFSLLPGLYRTASTTYGSVFTNGGAQSMTP